MADVDTAALKETEAEVASAGAAACLSMRVDVSEHEDVKAFKAALLEADGFGDVGFLFNNAGTGVGSASAFRDLAGWRRNLDVNLNGALHVLQEFVPSMIEQEGASTIVNTGSKQGITCPPGNLAYVRQPRVSIPHLRVLPSPLYPCTFPAPALTQ